MADTYQDTVCKSTEYKRSKVNSDMNFGLWSIIRWQCRFTDHKNTQTGDVNMREACMCGNQSQGKSLYLWVSWEFKTTFKNEISQE